MLFSLEHPIPRQTATWGLGTAGRLAFEMASLSLHTFLMFVVLAAQVVITVLLGSFATTYAKSSAGKCEYSLGWASPDPVDRAATGRAA
jgi:hypothetical protein